MKKVNLSKLLQNAGNPKIFVFEHDGKETLFVDTVWAVSEGIERLLDEEVSLNWGYGVEDYTPDNLIDAPLINDTKFRARSIFTEARKKELLAEIEAYKIRQSLKIEVLIP